MNKQISSLTITGIVRVLLSLVLLLLSPPSGSVDAALSCQTTEECVDILREGSECMDGECTNPYHKGGCLKQRLPPTKWQKTRVCHSEDPPGAQLLGHCVPPNPDFDYMEIRILTQDWESAFFQAWVLQIVLSEILGIPVTLESGTPHDLVDFYHPRSPLGYGVSYDYPSLRRANDIGDCRLVKSKDNDPANYQSCAHVLPEIWYGQQQQLDQLYQQGVIARPGLMGALGYQGLNIPISTGKKDPTLLTHLGLAGEENRHKLAQTFLRPTKWKDYCTKVSPDQCNTPDGVAARPPLTQSEESRYFLEGLYGGHFRATEKNDCVKYPHNCTGHVVDYPCGWNSFLQQQFYHLNIALESDGDETISNGYNYAAMTEIWAAANHTQSDVMMRWWTPEALYQTFLGTESEFQRVSLRPPTDDCLKFRVSSEDRCDLTLNYTTRVGEAEGSCDEPPFSLQRVFTQSLVDAANDPMVPEETRSPAYQTIENIRLTGLQIGKIFDYWLKRNSDKYNFDPRDAACRWVAENFDELIFPMVPETYPRVVEEKADLLETALYKISVSCSILSAICVAASAIGTIYNRKKKAIQLAQVNFLYLLLAGLSMVSMASIILNIPPSDGTCMAISWLVIQGYTFELVPLLFKVGAIATLMSASKKFKRVKLDKRKLLGGVFAVSAAVTLFLVIWTILDPSTKTADFQLTGDKNELGDTIVLRSFYCSSDSDAWLFISVGWHALLLLCGTVLAVQTRKLKRQGITESLVVAILVYSHFIFVVLRMLHFYFSENFQVWTLAPYMSLIFSCDVIAACSIYFFPKIFMDDNENRVSGLLRSSFPGTIFFAGSNMNSAPYGSSQYQRQGSGATDNAHHQRKGSCSVFSTSDHSPDTATGHDHEDGEDNSERSPSFVHHYDTQTLKEKMMDSQAAIMTSTLSIMGDDSFVEHEGTSFLDRESQRRNPTSGTLNSLSMLPEVNCDENDEGSELLIPDTRQKSRDSKEDDSLSGDGFGDERTDVKDNSTGEGSSTSDLGFRSISQIMGASSPSSPSKTRNFLKVVRDRMEDELLLGVHKNDDGTTEVSV